mmetsp:Transcript_13884/g.44443  ORF Transcript_13884/g.44443 Transcript_13884/m.44443 type:complete len:245 (-) Transcript_13884:401-1135(-)
MAHQLSLNARVLAGRARPPCNKLGCSRSPNQRRWERAGLRDLEELRDDHRKEVRCLQNVLWHWLASRRSAEEVERREVSVLFGIAWEKRAPYAEAQLGPQVKVRNLQGHMRLLQALRSLNNMDSVLLQVANRPKVLDEKMLQLARDGRYKVSFDALNVLEPLAQHGGVVQERRIDLVVRQFRHAIVQVVEDKERAMWRGERIVSSLVVEHGLEVTLQHIFCKATKLQTLVTEVPRRASSLRHRK